MIPRRSAWQRQPQGFTVVELLIVVGCIGLLTSMAIPAFQGLVIRSKQRERDLMMDSIRKSVMELISQNEKFPTDLGGGWSQILGDFNPPLPFSGALKQWSRGQPGWSSLAWEPSSMLRFHYYVFGSNWAGGGYFTVQAVSDLDGNGITATKTTTWTKDSGGTWSVTRDDELPPGES